MPRKRILKLFSRENVDRMARYRKAVPENRRQRGEGKGSSKKSATVTDSQEETQEAGVHRTIHKEAQEEKR